MVLTYWSFRDALVQTYTLPYVRKIAAITGKTVHLVTLEQPQLRMSETEQAAATAVLLKENIQPVFLDYRPFGPRAFFSWWRYIRQLAKLVRKENIDTIHAWCTPAGAIGAMLARKTNTRLIIDSFEPHAEAMVENGTWQAGSLAFRTLMRLEKRQARQAEVLIGLTENMRRYTKEKYGVQAKTFYVKPALIDFDRVPVADESRRHAARERLGFKDEIVGVYAGKTGGIYYDAEFFRLVRAAQIHWGEKFRLLLLTPVNEETIREQAAAEQVDMKNVLVRFVPQQEVFDYLAAADFAFNPVKPVPSKRCCTSIKDGEYWSAGLPVIIPPNISDDSDLIQQQQTGITWSDTSETGCRAAIAAMDQLLKTDQPALRRKIRSLAEQFRNMKIADAVYGNIYGKP